MNIIKQTLLDYLDPRSLSIFYDLWPDLRRDIRKILASPKHMLTPVSLIDDIILEPIEIDNMSLTLSHNGTLTIVNTSSDYQLVATVDHGNKTVYLSKLDILTHDLGCLLKSIDILHRHVIQLCSTTYKMHRGVPMRLTTPLIKRMDLSPTTRVAIPLNVVEQFKVNDISGLVTFQDKFIIF